MFFLTALLPIFFSYSRFLQRPLLTATAYFVRGMAGVFLYDLYTYLNEPFNEGDGRYLGETHTRGEICSEKGQFLGLSDTNTKNRKNESEQKNSRISLWHGLRVSYGHVRM